MRRLDNPVKHILTIGCLHPTLFDAGLRKLVEDVFIHFCNLLYLCVGNAVTRCNHIKVCRLCEAVTFCNKRLIAEHLQRTKVCPVVGKLLDLSLEVGLVQILRGVPYTYII